MVSPIILFAVIGAGIFFFSKGGLQQVKGFTDSIVSTVDRQIGSLVTPELQTGKGTVPIASGSQRTVNSIQIETILRTDVSQKRKFSPQADKPKIQTIFNNPKEGGVLGGQVGQIVGANLSIQSGQEFGKANFGLDQKEVDKIRETDFTDQELQDIANLTLRFDRKSISAQKVSDAPEEIIFKKREQEAIARKVIESQGGSFNKSGGFTTRGGNLIDVKGGLFGNSNFALGGKTPAEFKQQQADKAEIEAKKRENAILRKQRVETGEQVISTIKKSGLNQKQFFRQAGIALRGSGNLSSITLGKIIARTGTLRRVRPDVEPVEKVKVELTTKQVRKLSDAEKIARFRRGER